MNACSATERFTTFEMAELVMPRVIKSNGSREPFNEDKLRAGILRALEKRPVSMEAIEKAVNHIKSRLRATGEREVASELVGNLVMDELKSLDKVAYIRFASVYRSFEDIREFGEEMAKLGEVTFPSPRAGCFVRGAQMFSQDDYQWMSRALELARRGRYTTAPNPCVGAVLVKAGVVVGEGWHQRAGEPHAEVYALHAAGEEAAAPPPM